MRVYSFAFLLAAACTSSPAGSYTIPPPSTPDRTISMHCGGSVAEYCAAYRCNRTLDDAEHDTALCGPGPGPGLSACGDYDVVSKGYVDTGVALFYRSGDLVAIVNTGLLGQCVAGPETFDAPYCSGGDSAPLAACPSR